MIYINNYQDYRSIVRIKSSNFEINKLQKTTLKPYLHCCVRKKLLQITNDCFIVWNIAMYLQRK